MDSIVVISWFVLVTSLVTTAIDGRPDFERLRVKKKPAVGDSDRICSALIEIGYFREFFPTIDTYRTPIYEGSARTTMANVHGTLSRLDRRFTEELGMYVNLAIKIYNELVHVCLFEGSMRFSSELKKTRIDRETLSIFGCLDETDAGVQKDFDNFMLYSYVDRMYTRFRVLPVSHMDRYEQDDRLKVDTCSDASLYLTRLKYDFRLLSKPFRERYDLGWFDVYDVGWSIRTTTAAIDYPGLTKESVQCYNRLMREMKCKLWVFTYSNSTKIFETWDCTQYMDDGGFGFLSHKSFESSEENPYAAEDDTFAAYVRFSPERFDKYKESLDEVYDRVLSDMTVSNILVYNNMFAELYVYTVASISDRLFEGSRHFLYKYCVGLGENDTDSGVQNIRYLRTYLLLFRQLYGKGVDAIRNRLNVEVARFRRLEPMWSNLSKMIDITSVSAYDGETDGDKMRSMKTAVEAEYGRSEPLSGNTSYYTRKNVVAKKVYLTSPIIVLYDFLNLFHDNKNQH